jgi:hypothetical protein
MKLKPFRVIVCCLLVLLLSAVTGHMMAKTNKAKPSICSNPHPEQLCTAKNTCGTNGPCLLEVNRVVSGNGVSVKPNIEDFPKDAVLCIQAGASVTWQGAGKNTGVMVDFGNTSPFDPSGTIMAGSDRPITVVAQKPGCYKYTAGACVSGAIYGMCGNSDLEMVVTSGGK